MASQRSGSGSGRRPRLAIIGSGRAGSALALLLARRGWPIAAVAAARLGSARRLAKRCGAALATTDLLEAARASDAVLIAVPDRRIPEIARQLEGRRGNRLPRAAGARSQERRGPVPRRRIALHTSGARGAEALLALKRASPPWSIGSFHPLIAFPPAPDEPPALDGVTISLDGDPAARRLARDLAASLSARPVAVPSRDRGRYHLAACFAGNYIVTLAAEASALLVASGMSRRAALTALIPLMRSTLENLERAGLPKALTGPVARGDDTTIRAHAALLRRAPRPLRDLHRELVVRTIRMARSAGWIGAASARRLRRALEGRERRASTGSRQPIRKSRDRARSARLSRRRTRKGRS